MSHDQTTHDCTHVRLLHGPLDGLVAHLSRATFDAGTLAVPCFAGQYRLVEQPRPPYELPAWHWTEGASDGR